MRTVKNIDYTEEFKRKFGKEFVKNLVLAIINKNYE